MQGENMLVEYIKKNKHAVIFLFCFVFGMSLYANSVIFFIDSREHLELFPPFKEGVNMNHNTHLGAEYYYIAEAIASGKGYSNPFKVDTGPTAWMPPLYTYLLALLIILLKSRLLVACVVVFLKNIVLVFAGLVAYETAKKTFIRIKAEFILLLYAAWLLSKFRWYFQHTHDGWLLLFFICIIFPLAVFIRTNRISLKTAIIWGVVGGLSILAGPVAGLVWLSLWLISMLSARNIKMLSLSAVLFIAVCSPWFIRNYVVFDKFIFMKSNLFHDLYHFNYAQESGVLYELFVRQELVWTARKDPDCLYRRVGEAKFIEISKGKFFNAIKKDPYRFIRNLKERFLGALLINYPHYREYDKISLWRTALHAFPFFSVLLLVFFEGLNASSYIKVAILMYLIYLLPYIAVSYYVRYALPLTPLKILFCFWGLDLLVSRLSRATRANDRDTSFSSRDDTRRS